jgi:hypothetical protein
MSAQIKSMTAVGRSSSGCSMATICQIKPPIDQPSTSDGDSSSASMRPIATFVAPGRVEGTSPSLAQSGAVEQDHAPIGRQGLHQARIPVVHRAAKALQEQQALTIAVLAVGQPCVVDLYEAGRGVVARPGVLGERWMRRGQSRREQNDCGEPQQRFAMHRKASDLGRSARQLGADTLMQSIVPRDPRWLG